MREINLNRQKLGLEDLLFGVGIVTQIRAGQNVDVTKINAGNLPFDETQTLVEWAQSVNLEELSSMVTELQAIYDNLTAIGNVEDNLTVINTLEDNLVALNSLYTNISKLQNIDTNMSKLQNIDTNMSKLQNIDTNMSKLQAIYTDLTKLESIYDNLTMLLAIYNNLTALNNINSQVIPNLTELLLVNDNAIQVAADKLTVATDKGIVSGYKEDVSAMKVAVETIYDTFDDRFLGVKTSDPLLDNDGNILQDGAIYFNSSFHALKVYGLVTLTWYTIPQIYLSALLDVTLTSITTGDILTWNGTKWVNIRTPSFDSVKLNGGTGTQGTVTWNNTELTYDLVLNDNVTLQVGQEEVVYCKNNTLTTIPNGKPVMAVGTNGNILIDLHDGTKASARRIVGLTTQPILPSNNANPYGFVTRNGKVTGLNTTGSDYGEVWTNGDILYVKATGALTKFEPADTALKMPIAFVIHAHTNGTLYVRTTGIDENHDRDLIATKVTRVTSTDNAIVRFDGTTGVVQNSSVTVDDNGNIGSGTQSFNGFGGTGFKNYIINGGFDVWQRGTSGVSNSSAVGPDMWRVWANVANTNWSQATSADFGTYGSNIRFGLKWYGDPASVQDPIEHRIESKNAINLSNKYVTISFVAKSSVTQTVSIELIKPNTEDNYTTVTAISSSSISVTTTATKFSVTLLVDDVKNGLSLVVRPSVKNQFMYIAQVQLEKGSVATPFEQRPYGLELSLCQRYYEVALIVHSTNTAYTCGYWKVSKRVPPTLSVFQLTGTGMPSFASNGSDSMFFQNGAPTGVGTAQVSALGAEL